METPVVFKNVNGGGLVILRSQKMHQLRLVPIVLLIFLLVVTSSFAKRSIPEDNLAYPVFLLLDTGGTGSGFFLSTADATFFITARHVLFNCKGTCSLKAKSATLTSYGRDPNDSSKNILSIDLQELIDSGTLKYHQNQDAAAMKIAKKSASEPGVIHVTSGVLVKSSAVSGIIGVAIDNVKPFKDVLVANDVFIFGYPSSIGIRNIPQIDYERPLLRKGIVAGLNHKELTIIIDAAAYGGNSGGPVIEIDPEGFGYKLRLIGLISEFIPFAHKLPTQEHVTLTNSGYAVITPTDFILELIDQ